MILDKGKVEVTSSSPEFGEAREPIAIEYSGPSLTICFNAQYVLDFLGVVESEVVALELKDEVSQAVMKPVGGRRLRLHLRHHADARVSRGTP